MCQQSSKINILLQSQFLKQIVSCMLVRNCWFIIHNEGYHFRQKGWSTKNRNHQRFVLKQVRYFEFLMSCQKSAALKPPTKFYTAQITAILDLASRIHSFVKPKDFALKRNNLYVIFCVICLPLYLLTELLNVLNNLKKKKQIFVAYIIQKYISTIQKYVP